MVSRWSLLIQTPLSGEIRSWRRPSSPWLVRRATRRIIILYLNITNTSKCFPHYVIFHAITRTRFFIHRSAYLFFNSTILQLGLQNPPDTLRFSSETIRDMVPNWNTIKVSYSLINIGGHSSTARWTDKHFTAKDEHCDYSLSQNSAIHYYSTSEYIDNRAWCTFNSNKLWVFSELKPNLFKFITNVSWIQKKNYEGKISAQPHRTLCIQFPDRENNDKNNTLPLRKQICFSMVWGCAENLSRSITIPKILINALAIIRMTREMVYCSLENCLLSK